MKKIIFILFFTGFTFLGKAQFEYAIPTGLHSTQTIQNRYKEEQQSSSWFDKSRLTFGGGFGLQFGDYTVVNISPQVGYNFSQYINAGVGLNYTYYREKYWYDGNRMQETSNYFGMNVYGKLYPIPNIILMVQPEANRMWKSVKDRRTGEKWSNNKFVPVVLVGGGLRLGPVTAMIQYDVVQDDDSPYGDSIFYSVGYTFGF